VRRCKLSDRESLREDARTRHVNGLRRRAEEDAWRGVGRLEVAELIDSYDLAVAAANGLSALVDLARLLLTPNAQLSDADTGSPRDMGEWEKARIRWHRLDGNDALADEMLRETNADQQPQHRSAHSENREAQTWITRHRLRLSTGRGLR